MLNYQLIKAIFSEPWAIDGLAIDTMSPLVAALFTPNMAFEASEPIQPSAAAYADPKSGTTKTVRIIPIQGSLTKYDQSCGPVGMATVGRWIQQANSSKEIDAIVLRIDSPGGTVSGTEDLADIIKSSQKPVVAFIEDMACSAAYWLASCCEEVIANNSTAQVGSVGVLMSFADAQPMWEAKGVKFHTVTAPQSTDKTKTYEDLRAGNYDEYKNTVLAPLAQKFIETVKGNRSAITDAQCTGKVYFAKDAIGSFVDSIGSLDTAVQRAASLSSPSASANSPKILNMSYKRLAKVASVPAFESVDGTIALTEDMAQAVETALESAETERANLEERTTELETANGRVQELEARVAELEGAAGAGTAKVIADTDTPGATGESTFWDRLDACQEHLQNR